MGDEKMPSMGELASLRTEIARDEALRRDMWEKGEPVDRPTAMRSVFEPPTPAAASELTTADQWNYRIEPYRPSPERDGGWTPAPEAEATAWFGFRDRGEDRRCFGVFPSRADAEKAMAMIQESERQPTPEQGRGRGR
jgi:hypothetical protein